MELDLLINDAIRERRVRVIDQNGQMLGIMDTYNAQQKAYGQNLDLVLINAKAVPPVCKILDYGKYKFEEDKKQRELKKKQREKAIELKEVQLRPTTDQNDLKIKASKIKEFLDDGNKVKIMVKFHGREVSHPEQGHLVLKSLLSFVGETYKVEQDASLNNRNMIMIIQPLPKVANVENAV